MDHTHEVVVPPNLARLLFSFLIGGAGVIIGLLMIFGFGPIPTAVATGVGGLTILAWIVGAVRRRPRLEINSEGFTAYSLVGEYSQKWEDIQGPFSVISIGPSKAVAYNLTDEYKNRPGTKRRTPIAGHDAAISGALALSAARIAELLNERRALNLNQSPPASN